MTVWRIRFSILVLPALLFSGALAQPVTIRIGTGTAGMDFQLMEAAVERYMELNPDVTVRLLLMPELTDDRFDLVRNFLELESPEIDILQLDVIWPTELARHLVDLGEYGLQEEAQRHFPRFRLGDTVDGRLMALPWSANMGTLYYRQDLLERYGFAGPPLTWRELEEQARVIQAGERAAGNGRFWGFVWQGAPYEGLTVNIIEWFSSNGAGTVVEPTGVVSVLNHDATAMLQQAAGWINDISPWEVLGYAEAEALDVMAAGEAAFMRGWSSEWYGLRDLPAERGVFAATALPAGDGANASRVGVLGGSSLAVSAYSRHPDLAMEVVRFLASEAEQRHRAISSSYGSTIIELYQDPEVRAAIPFSDDLLDGVTIPVERPSRISGEDYASVSRMTYNTIHGVLAGREDVTAALSRLSRQLQHLLDLPPGAPAPQSAAPPEGGMPPQIGAPPEGTMPLPRWILARPGATAQ